MHQALAKQGEKASVTETRSSWAPSLHAAKSTQSFTGFVFPLQMVVCTFSPHWPRVSAGLQGSHKRVPVAALQTIESRYEQWDWMRRKRRQVKVPQFSIWNFYMYCNALYATLKMKLMMEHFRLLIVVHEHVKNICFAAFATSTCVQCTANCINL